MCPRVEAAKMPPTIPRAVDYTRRVCTSDEREQLRNAAVTYIPHYAARGESTPTREGRGVGGMENRLVRWACAAERLLKNKADT